MVEDILVPLDEGLVLAFFLTPLELIL